ncbi:type VI secretion system baseplate subunit TssF [Xenorhabdus budapestensis]|uniref:Uncharacterized protein n=1 Tax=Xenorhabdus budapestensis TaxID=290110 RepID=A0A2D0IYH0_XENBU|nr:type VI secretion system baseplate subunit TssF [Xenorhabdus budapestensis]PHM27005.1 hypothetical protein Xbud_02575 [Xenorhabdus budapestensis]
MKNNKESLYLQERTVKKTGIHSEIILTLCQTGTVSPVWRSGALSFFLGTDTEKAAQLSLWLDQHLCDVSLTIQGEQRKLRCSPYVWHNLFDSPVLPASKNTYSGLQPLVEYYALPQLYNFVTLDIRSHCVEIPLNADGTFELVFRFEGELPLNNVDEAFLLGYVPAIHLENQTSPSILLDSGNHSYPLPLGESVRLFRLRDIQVVQQPDDNEQRGTPYHWLPIEQFTPAGYFLDEDYQPDTFYYQLQTERDFLDRTQHRLHFFDLMGKPANHLPTLSVSGYFIGYYEQACALEQGTITVTQEGSPSLSHRT